MVNWSGRITFGGSVITYTMAGYNGTITPGGGVIGGMAYGNMEWYSDAGQWRLRRFIIAWPSIMTSGGGVLGNMAYGKNRIMADADCIISATGWDLYKGI